ncbi:MAG: hypothetical protein AAGC65_01695 [Mucilaginibacter sp.]|uniref:hypothetical protein n=1 Tax=Mucilaginibacter sp. TaxID=1882438 RepID=UPI0031A58E15
MLLFFRLLMLLLLAVVYLQDMRYRGVSWIIFSLLFVAVVAVRHFSGQSLAVVGESLLVNMGVLTVILSLLILYLLLKHLRFVNITEQYLGWGDIFFFLILALYLSVLNFLFFFVVSLLFTGVCHAVFVGFNKDKYIPLAGFQALLLMLLLAADWWYFHLGVMDDYWLLRYYMSWIQV